MKTPMSMEQMSPDRMIQQVLKGSGNVAAGWTLLDISGKYFQPHILGLSDAEASRADWQAIGSDLQAAHYGMQQAIQ